MWLRVGGRVGFRWWVHDFWAFVVCGVVGVEGWASNICEILNVILYSIILSTLSYKISQQKSFCPKDVASEK